jgi:hypothetical protein
MASKYLHQPKNHPKAVRVSKKVRRLNVANVSMIALASLIVVPQNAHARDDIS